MHKGYLCNKSFISLFKVFLILFFFMIWTNFVTKILISGEVCILLQISGRLVKLLDTLREVSEIIPAIKYLYVIIVL